MNFSVTSITYFIGFTMKKWFLQIVCGLEVENLSLHSKLFYLINMWLKVKLSKNKF